jgi:hypothetical protein
MLGGGGWRVAFAHGSAWRFDDSHASGYDGAYCGTVIPGYCQLFNDYNVDFVLAGHSGYGFARHLAPSGDPKNDFIFSFRPGGGKGATPEIQGTSTVTKNGYAHLRVRRDAIVLSRLWYGCAVHEEGDLTPDTPDPALLQDVCPADGSPCHPSMGALMECTKVVPGMKGNVSGCDAAAAGCVDVQVPVTLRNSASCPTQLALDAADTAGAASFSYCCQPQTCAPTERPPPAPPGGCSYVYSGTDPVGLVCVVKFQVCPRDRIPAGCLRRQILPIVTDEWYPLCSQLGLVPHVSNADLLQECTPCASPGVYDPGELTRVTSDCGKPPSWWPVLP